MSVERQRSRDAAAKGIAQDEIQRADHWQFVTRHIARCDGSEMRLDAFGGDVLAREAVMRLVKGDQGDVRGVAQNERRRAVS
jgi:hypothetical protein